ncbi:MAG: chalcone isomerase family protein [Polyangiaceae bacterium]
MNNLRISRRTTLVAMLGAAAALTVGTSAFALDRGTDGYFHTGSGTRVKHVTLLGNFDVYVIGHAMKDLPPTKSKQAVIDIDTSKYFAWTMLRAVDQGKIQDALREAYQMNGYGDTAKINQALSVFTSELAKGGSVRISYDSGTKATTFSVGGGSSTTVPSIEFMKATWSIWFGKIDQPALSDLLISKI